MATFNDYFNSAVPVIDYSTETTLTTTTTVSTFYKSYVVSGASDYTITLPAASGNNGKLIAFRITGSALFTIKGNGAELIDGENTRVMWLNESATLLCDGTGWTKIAGKTIPFVSKAWKNASQTTGNEVNTVIQYQVKDENFNIFDLTNNRMSIPREGEYQAVYGLYQAVSGAGRTGMYWDVNAVEGNLFPVFNKAASPSSVSGGSSSRIFTFAKNDLLRLKYRSTTASNALAGNDTNYFQIKEIPTW